MKKICVITDNEYLYEKFKEIICSIEYTKYKFDFYYSEKNQIFCDKFKDSDEFRPINLKVTSEEFYQQYHMFLSLHCKQLFPSNLTDNHRCINVHPGYNPYNRGWFPQVFSILNKKPIGVTIHEIDNELDHGSIIFQEFTEIRSWDTSWSLYCRIQEKEVEMIETHLLDLIEERYTAIDMIEEGNVNYKSDFDQLCRIDLNKQATYGEMIDLLRAMTFAQYDNLYFLDEKGNKIYISIILKQELHEQL